MSGRSGVDPSSKLGRTLFQLVDATLKMTPEIRARVVRIRNMIESAPDDPMVGFRVEPELAILMRESRLNPYVRALRKAMRGF